MLRTLKKSQKFIIKHIAHLCLLRFAIDSVTFKSKEVCDLDVKVWATMNRS